MLVCAFGTLTHAAAQGVNPPDVPDTIKPEAGNTAFLVGHAFGTQGYTCLPTSTGGTAWSASARPEATLFADEFQQFQLITRRLREALALVDIRVLDHCIVGDNGCLSFAERGLL
jgi:hypothetical protein